MFVFLIVTNTVVDTIDWSIHLDMFVYDSCDVFQVERRNVFSERGNVLHSLNSDEEEDGYDSPHTRRRGASVDEFLRGSELGRHVSPKILSNALSGFHVLTYSASARIHEDQDIR